MEVAPVCPRLHLTLALRAAAFLVLGACATAEEPVPGLRSDDPGGAEDEGRREPPEAMAGSMVLYELQVRSVNACDPEVGAPRQRAACARKPAPLVTYPHDPAGCGELAELQRIRLGTLDDLGEDTADPGLGITLRYLEERLGINSIWLMPVFPNNDAWGVAAPCDNLGSPYAVRDYLHVSGMLSRACIAAGRDERSEAPCWGNDALDATLASAHSRGQKVLLDLAFNHFGHNYLFYDAASFTPVRERIARGEDLDRLWDFAGTFDPALVHPELVDTPARLEDLARRDGAVRETLASLKARCPALEGDTLVRAFDIWRDALDWERQQMACDSMVLESAAPGFYLGKDRQNPSLRVGDNFSGDGPDTWDDVKFLFHHEDNVAHRHELVRNREYLFRIMNHWASRGVDGFRLDHSTDGFSGLGPNEWRYIAGKVAFYSARRGQPRPILLAEEFHDQVGIAPVVDIMTEGYIHDMTKPAGLPMDSGRAEAVLTNTQRFAHTYVMTGLETHDEERLTESTGWSVWVGAGMWGLGASTWSVPMLFAGQELGEPRRLGFRKSDYLRSRFEGAPGHRADADTLLDFYRRMITARSANENRALRGTRSWFLRTRASDGTGIDPRLLARARWSDDGNAVFTFFNFWEQHVAQSYYLPPELARQISLRDDLGYRTVDTISGVRGPCRPGRELKWDFAVDMDAATRILWLRLERCEP